MDWRPPPITVTVDQMDISEENWDDDTTNNGQDTAAASAEYVPGSPQAATVGATVMSTAEEESSAYRTIKKEPTDMLLPLSGGARNDQPDFSSLRATCSARPPLLSTNMPTLPPVSSMAAAHESFPPTETFIRRRRRSSALIPFELSQGFGSARSIKAGFPANWPTSDPFSSPDRFGSSSSSMLGVPSIPNILSSPMAPIRRAMLAQSPPIPPHNRRPSFNLLRRHTEPHQLHIATPSSPNWPGIDPSLVQPFEQTSPTSRKRPRSDSNTSLSADALGTFVWRPHKRRNSADGSLESYEHLLPSSPGHYYSDASSTCTTIEYRRQSFDYNAHIQNQICEVNLEEVEEFERGVVAATPVRIKREAQEPVIIKAELADVKEHNGRLSLERLCEIISQYLRDPTNEFTIIVTQSTAAQKSYGEEKRFFTPPVIRLLGGGWALSPLKKAYENMPGNSSTIRKSKTRKFEIRLSTVLPSLTSHSNASAQGASQDTVHSSAEDTHEDDEAPRRSSGTLNSVSGLLADVTYEQQRVDLLSRTSSLRDRPDARNLKPVAVGVFQKLHVGNSEKRKMVPLFFKINAPAGPFVYESKPFTKISKPSKKKQTGNTQLLIFSGSTIAIFNRTKSQTNSTRFLGVEPSEMTLIPSASIWDNWVIFTLDDPRFNRHSVPGFSPMSAAPIQDGYLQDVKEGEAQDDLVWTRPVMEGCEEQPKGCGRTPPATPMTGRPTPAGRMGRNQFVMDVDCPSQPIHYGDTVVLQNCSTGLVTRPMVVRRIENRTSAVIDSNVNAESSSPRPDPLSPLQKVAFQLEGQPGRYLSLNSRFGQLNVDVHRTRLSNSSSSRRDRGRRRTCDGEDEHERDYEVDLKAKRKKGKGRSKKDAAIQDDVGESCIWTIVGTDQVECTFHLPMLTAEEFTAIDTTRTISADSDSDSDPELFSSEEDCVSRASPTPQPKLLQKRLPLSRVCLIPIVDSVSHYSRGILSLAGENLRANLWVFFGSTPTARTRYQCAETILVDVPNFGDRSLPTPVKREYASHEYDMNQRLGNLNDGIGGKNGLRKNQQPHRKQSEVVPILLVRDDGVVFRTGHYYLLQ